MYRLENLIFIENEDERNLTLAIAIEDLSFRTLMGTKTTLKDVQAVLQQSLIVARRVLGVIQ